MIIAIKIEPLLYSKFVLGAQPVVVLWGYCITLCLGVPPAVLGRTTGDAKGRTRVRCIQGKQLNAYEFLTGLGTF